VNFLDLIKNPVVVAFAAGALALGGFTLSKSGSVVTPTPSPTSSSEITPSPLYTKVRIQIFGVNRQLVSDADVTISSGAPVKTEKSNSSGYVEFEIPSQSKRVTVVVTKPGFQGRSDDIDLQGDNGKTTPIYLTPIESVVSPSSEIEKKNRK
jgi:hypothetical protein